MIKRAAVELLELQGFSNLTVEGIAARAGVGKATIYRWWPTKAHLAVQAYLESAAYQIPEPSTGCVRTDIIDQLKAFAQLCSGKEGRVISGIIGAAQESPELRIIVRDEWLARRRSVTLRSLELGKERGQLCPETNLENLLDALVGPFYLALMMDHREISAIDVEQHVAMVFEGAAAPRFSAADSS